MNSFGFRLGHALDKAQLTQDKLANEIGVSKATVANWVQNKTFPPADDLLKICRKLACSSDWLLGLSLRPSQDHEYKGIRWVISVPSDVPNEHETELELGKSLFFELVEKNQDLDMVLRNKPFVDHDISYLYACFRIAVQTGILRILEVPQNNQLEDELKQKFDLKEVIVADIPGKNDGTLIRAEFVAFLAARNVFSKMRNQHSIGVGAGYTLLRMAELATPTYQFHGTQWIPLQSASALQSRTGRRSANHIALTLASKFPGSQSMYLPFIYKDSSQVDQRTAAHVMRAAANVSTVFLSLGGTGRKPRSSQISNHNYQFRPVDALDETGVLANIYSKIIEQSLENNLVGEILGYMLDASATVVGNGDVDKLIRESILAIELDVLRTIAQRGKIWVVAARDYKAKPTLMAIRNGLANCLIVDSEIAEYLVSHVEF